ncbi:INSYN2B protein-like [Apteryx mantelli]|uniref:INSYN2B protein-like n=1 Tax=Apteryx mantelli TaxID=2696672 RepID=A0ABM4EPE5_9AVES
MPGREPGSGSSSSPGAAAGGRGAQEKAIAVRSVLLNRDSPDVESRRQRRRHRTQQVRFKDLVEGGAGRAPSPPEPPPAAPRPDTPRASPPPRDAPEPAALRASAARRSWPQPQPQPQLQPGKACASAAIQTSPSLQKPFPAPSRGPPPPPGDPHAPRPGAARCPAAGCTSTAQSCCPGAERCPRPPACSRPRGGPPRPASVPCARPPAEPLRLGRSDSERSLPWRPPPPPPAPKCQQTVPTAATATATQGLRQPAQGSSQRDPPHQRCSSPWGGPCCTPPPAPSPGAPPPAPGGHGSAVAAPEKTPAALGRPGPCGAALPEPAAARRSICAGAQPAGRALQDPRHAQPCLAAEQSETLRHVQDLLQLVAAANGQVGPPPGDERTRTSQGQGAAGPRGPGDRGDLQSQLQSLEGVLETSQQTIRVLLDVIQDLEKKEAQRDGRHSYRTGQDIANCGTCRDCACIIYSVEHDFRQQEGRFQQVLSNIESEASQSSPTVAGAVQPGRQEPSPVSKLPAKLDSKKSRRKCFWFL